MNLENKRKNKKDVSILGLYKKEKETTKGVSPYNKVKTKRCQSEFNVFGTEEMD